MTGRSGAGDPRGARGARGTREAVWPWLRLAAAALVLSAVITQAVISISGAVDGGRDVATTTVNFFSFFTVLSNIAAMVVLAVGATRAVVGPDSVERRPYATALAAATVYMTITGIVYNLLLRGIPLPQGTTVPWANEILHVVGPLVLVADLLFAPRRRALPWSAALAALAFPLAWVVYTLVRGPLTTDPVTGAPFWYPYPFLNPNNPTLSPSGYGGVAVYVVGITIAFAVVAVVVVAIGRRRGRADRPRA